MKTLGIIGGVGPETTSKVYQSVTSFFRENKIKNYPSIVIYNLPFPFTIENEAIVKSKNSHKMLPYLISGAKVLEKAGASFGVLPCNTLHKFMKEIRASVKIPFLNIVEETVSILKKKKISSVGILATGSTVSEKLYDHLLKKNKINPLYPTKAEQNKLNKIILGLLRKKKPQKHIKIIESICKSLQNRGAKVILLACTDLQLIKIKSRLPILDTLEILIQASLRELVNK